MNTRKSAAICLGLMASLTSIAGQAGLSYGPDTCMQGYVWRDAVADDHICVTPESRAQAASDNAQAGIRIQPGGGHSGPNTCLPGYVWREAREGDLVCVTPQTRSQTAEENRRADSRRAQTVCARYAQRAVAQFQMTSSRPGCSLSTDARWHANYQAHFDWCTTAQPAWLRSEQGARAQYLSNCGRQVMIDQGPELVPADD
jgi:hypothetical protein